MTRTRTQTALTSFVTLVANVHGELAFVEGALASLESEAAVELKPGRGKRRSEPERERLREGLQRRRRDLEADRDALYLTLRRFDPGLDPTSIGSVEDWLKPFGRGTAGGQRYETLLMEQERSGTKVQPGS